MSLPLNNIRRLLGRLTEELDALSATAEAREGQAFDRGVRAAKGFVPTIAERAHTASDSPLDYETRVIKDRMVHINGIPVMVSGTARTHRENWKLIYPEALDPMRWRDRPGALNLPNRTAPDWHGIPIEDPSDHVEPATMDGSWSPAKLDENKPKVVSEVDRLREQLDIHQDELRRIEQHLRAIGITLKYRDDGSFVAVEFDKLGSGA